MFVFSLGVAHRCVRIISAAVVADADFLLEVVASSVHRDGHVMNKGRLYLYAVEARLCARLQKDVSLGEREQGELMSMLQISVEAFRQAQHGRFLQRALLTLGTLYHVSKSGAQFEEISQMYRMLKGEKVFF